jgi:phospholipid/cholesterol/gamma-HCH transport system ATP-binding protein
METNGNEYSHETVISIRGLSKAFNGNQVLKDVNIDLRKAENLVVLGKSGSGKSTIIKCLVRLIEPDGGNISAFGKDMTGAEYDELNSLRTKIGFLFQGNALYDSMTVYENLAFPLRHHNKDITMEKIDSEIKEVLESVGLPDAGGLMPSELSGGMSKRVGLARTLILKPEVMLYDEPTTGLDTVTAKEISHLMLDLKQKYHISSLIITHDIPVTKMISDRIVMLKEGTIVAEGTYEELTKKDDEWIKSFFS